MSEQAFWNRLTREQCACGSGLEPHNLYDARAIYCARVCEACEERKRAGFRPEIFSDPNYWTAEPVEEDE